MIKLKAVTLEERIEKALELANYDINVKYNYLLEQLEFIADVYLDISRQIAENEVEIEILRRLNMNNQVNTLIEENYLLEKVLVGLDAREEILLDLLDEMIKNLLA